MKITLQRCFKKPGLIIRAKTYFLELNDNGLYIIALGNATVMPRTRTFIQQAIAEKAVSHFKDKYEVEIVASEERIRNGQLDIMAKEKYSYFLDRNAVTVFAVSNSGNDALKIKIKGQGVNIELLADAAYSPQVQEMAQMLGH